jgi:hypothetical protein
MQILILTLLLFLQTFAAANFVKENTSATLLHSENPEKPTSRIIFQSVDNGQTWQDISAGLPSDIDPRGMITCNGEVFLKSGQGLFRSNTVFRDVRWKKDELFPEHTTSIYRGETGLYTFRLGSGFFREINTGMGVWLPVYPSFKDEQVLCVLETPDGIIFTGCNTGIFKSADGGLTWKRVFSKSMVTDLVASNGVIIGAGFKGLLRSTDGGENWEWMLTENGSIRKTCLINDRFVVITNGDSPSKDAMGNFDVKNRMLTSSDGGMTWQSFDANLKRDGFINDIEQVGEYLFCSLDSGIFRSSDMGATWEFVFSSSDRKRGYQLAVSGKVIYAVIAMAGC